MEFRKKPVVISAVRFLNGNFDELQEFTSGTVLFEGGEVLIETLEGTMKCSEGDWIIKGVKGEFYPCKPDIFEATYDKV